MNDSVARIVRTILQAVAGAGVVEIAEFFAGELPDRFDQYAYPVAFLVVAIAQNLLEEWSGKALLRPASPPTPKAVDPVAEV